MKTRIYWGYFTIKYTTHKKKYSKALIISVCYDFNIIFRIKSSSVDELIHIFAKYDKRYMKIPK